DKEAGQDKKKVTNEKVVYKSGVRLHFSTSVSKLLKLIIFMDQIMIILKSLFTLNPSYTQCDRTLKVWSLDGLPDDLNDSFILKSKVVKAVHDKDTNAVAIAPTGLLSTGSQDHTMCIWKHPDLTPDGSCLGAFKGHTSTVFKVQFLTRGARLVYYGADVSNKYESWIISIKQRKIMSDMGKPGECVMKNRK
ncbi:transducin beta-like protein 3, partial [Tanacetum coccineum]